MFSLVFHEAICVKGGISLNPFMHVKIQAYFTVYLQVAFCPRKLFYLKLLSFCSFS